MQRGMYLVAHCSKRTPLDQATVEVLRALFLQDLLARPLVKEEQAGGLWDRQGNHFFVFDIDGTREAARQRALPQTEDRPAPARRLRPMSAPGYTGRKRGEVVRTRTTVLQAHTHQWLASFGHAGNGQYRVELRRALAMIEGYLQTSHVPTSRAVVRLDGQYGSKAALTDLADFSYITHGKDYRILDQDDIQARLTLPSDQQLTHPESGIVRFLYDCPDRPLDKAGRQYRVEVATQRAGETRSRQSPCNREQERLFSCGYFSTVFSSVTKLTIPSDLMKEAKFTDIGQA
ncbi:MAG TPA: hypothetical protein VL485_24730 [Ktedonobacteraceae bacterium]|jgi:hypothetical protein|nr:hypothetical protein [Ktedonobacteraceae bacterium]